MSVQRPPHALTTEQLIEWLRQRGSSLALNWGEDTGCWEVDWITGGARYRGVSKSLQMALLAAFGEAEALTRLRDDCRPYGSKR